MKKNWCSRLFALLLCVGLMLCASAPVLAAAPIESLKVVIHNNEGMGAMTDTMFKVYQLFTGTPNWEGEPELDGNQWAVPDGNTQWNNWTLADVQWGASVPDANQQTLIDALTELDSSTAAWAWPEGSNVFAHVDSAASVAAVLADHFDNAFMQAFMKWLFGNSYINPIQSTTETVGTDNYSVALNNGTTVDNYSDDTLTYTFGQTGYYLFAPDSTVLEDQPLSEFIVAVVGYQDIYIKTSQPSLDKVIENDPSNAEDDAYAAVAGVGDTLTFKITAGLPASFADYTKYSLTLTDTLSKGLTYTGDLKVVLQQTDQDDALKSYKISVDDTPADQLDNNGYTVSPDPEPGTLPEKDTTITVSFADLRHPLTISESDDTSVSVPGSVIVKADAKFVVTYTAQVNQNAEVSAGFTPPSGDSGTYNFNNVAMKYSNNPNDDTSTATEPGPTDYVFVFALDLNKQDENQNGLPDAGFYLTKDNQVAILNHTKASADNVVTEAEIVNWVGLEDNLPTEITQSLGSEKKSFNALLDDYEKQKQDTLSTDADVRAAAEEELKKIQAVLDAHFLVYSRDANDELSIDAGSVPPISGLGDGTYTFTELVVPDGYNGIAPIIFTVTSQLNESKNALADVTFKFPGNDPEIQNFTGELATFHGHLTATVENEKAPLLPFTGGLGATMIYAAGFVFVVVSLVFLMLNRKKQRVA